MKLRFLPRSITFLFLLTPYQMLSQALSSLMRIGTPSPLSYWQHAEKALKKQKFIYFLIFAVCVFYSSMPATVFGQTPIEMPDTVLASVVRDALGLGATAPITDMAMLNLTQLDATSPEPADDKISDLTGLEHATNLTLLELWGNSVTDISPLSDLTNLDWLALNNNTIIDVRPLAKLTNLTVLALSDNSISDLRPLSNLTSLATFQLINNQVSDVRPLAKLTSLTVLDLERNLISDVRPLVNLTSLITLSLHANSLTDVSALSGLTNLTHLDLGSNSLSDLNPLSGLTTLEQLDLGSNSLSDLNPLLNLTNLERLDLNNSAIIDVGPLSGLTSLTELNLISNSITDVSALANLTNLTRLDIKWNPILDTSPLYSISLSATIDITPTEYPPWDVNQDGSVDGTDVELVTAALGEFLSLTDPRTDVNGSFHVDNADLLLVMEHASAFPTVKMPDANLAAAVRTTLVLGPDILLTPTLMQGLTRLEAPSMTISDLTGLEAASNLEVAVLSENAISTLDALSGLTRLTWLNLSGNDVSNISSLSNLTRLTYLNLSGNDVSDISSLSRLTGLTELQLNHNTISNIISLSSLTSLTRLGLAYNSVSDVNALSGLTGMWSLYLNNNTLSDVNALSDLTNLRILSLSDNSIRDVSPLSSLIILSELYLGNNQILDTSVLYPLLPLDVDIEISAYPPWDVNADGFVDTADSDLVRAALGQTGDSITDPRTDVNADGTVDTDDISLVITHLSVSIVPDVNLAAAIRDELGLSPSATLTTTDMEDLTTLSVRESEIRNLTGLEHATNLTFLNLNRNSVSDVRPLAGLTQLEELNIHYNLLSDVSPLSELTSLETLDLSRNSISDVSRLATLTNLTNLALYSNFISDVGPLANLTTNLTGLKLSGNSISNVRPLARLTTLGSLDLQDNLLSDVSPLSRLANLTWLGLGQNSIRDVRPLSSLTELTYLDLGENSITDVRALSGLINLKTLDLFLNSIKDVSALANLTNLTFLALQDNSITDVSPLATLIELTNLKIKGNPVLPASLATLVTLTKLKDKDFEIPETIDIPDTGLAAALRNALGLDQHLPILPTQLAALPELDAKNRRITDLTTLAQATALIDLDLGSNSITDLSALENLTSLTSLNLRNNRITDVLPLVGLTNLETLDLTGNTGITNVEVLFRLQLGGTQIKGVTVPNSVVFPDANLETAVRTALTLPTNQPILPSSLAALTTLPASNSGITDLTGIEAATGLTSLTLSNNQITDVSPLVSLTNLETLDLTGNTGITNAAVLYSLQVGGTQIDITVPDSVVFSDMALADALRSALGLAADARIPSDRLVALTRLNAANRGIADLTGLENAVSLTTLDLRNNMITDVSPLAGLTHLRTLNLTDNAVSNPEALITLDQGGTRITGVTVPHEVVFPDAALANLIRETLRLGDGMPIFSNKLAALTSLSGNERGITDLTGLEQATGLTFVLLGGNTISDLSPLSNLTDLGTLDLYADRQISDISPLANLTNLTFLRLWGNLVRDISVLSRLTSLTQLNLGYNLITDVSPLADLTSLKWLTLIANPVANLEALLPLKQRGGTFIDIYIPSVVAIPDMALAGAVRAALELADNAPIPPDALATLTTLAAPSLGITQLTGLEAATGLTQLILNDNQIRDVDPLAQLTNLETLNLRDNQITDVWPLRLLTHLRTLDVSNNPVQNIGVLLPLKQGGTRITGATIPNTLTFRDEALEEVVRAALDLGDTDPILPDDLATLTRLDITRLDLSNRRIRDLRGIEFAMRLQTLNLRDHQITDVLPIAGLTRLTRLVLDGNPVENPEVLFRLKQAGTRITGVEVPNSVFFADMGLEAAVHSALRLSAHYPITAASMATLTQLTATRKEITDLTGLEEATRLERLDLGDNEITDISLLSDLMNLENLDLADNEIMDIAVLSGLTNLEVLDLRNNKVTDTALLSTMTHLKNLYVRGNENLSSLKQLVRLTEAGTRVDITLPRPVSFPDDNLKSALRTALAALPTLTLLPDDPIFPEDMEMLITFSAPNPGIVNLTGLETATNLTTLTLSNNQIVSLSPLSRLTSLTDLDLATNQISSISSLSGLTNLTILNLSNNQIVSLSPLSRLTNLTDMDLSNNQISSVSSLSGLTKLTELLLLNNRIRDVLPLQGLSSLDTLNLSGNTDLTQEKAEVLYKLLQGGTRITFPAGITPPMLTNIVVFNNTDLEAAVRSVLRITKGYPILITGEKGIDTLTRLTATRKEIADLTGLEKATGLMTLDLGDNAIETLTPLQNLTKLTTLDLADNDIEDLTPLQGLTSLTSLDLDDNEIEDVSALSGLTSLQALDLRDNKVGDVAPLMDLTNLKQIYLRGNEETLINLAWLGALPNLRSDIKLPDVVRLPDTNLDRAVREALRTAGQTVSDTLPMSEELLESLVALDASSEGISDLTGCEYMTELTSLDLSNNQITDVSPLSKLYSLETLMLAGNPILDTSVLRELERRGTDIDITIYRYPSWDVNQDSDVDEADVFLITATITGESPDVNGDGTPGDPDDTEAADANKDGTVNTDDLLLVFEKFDRPVNLAAPLLSAESVGLDWALLERIDADRLRVQLEILRAENDGSLKYQQAIAFLQAVLVALHPNQTLLLANYPNPFNPETWIPYQLARGSNVWITIYDTRGALVRRLELGYRAEGYYRVRGRAAHWDGRNTVSERVASGLYFYQLETDNVSLLRKMVILK